MSSGTLQHFQRPMNKNELCKFLYGQFPKRRGWGHRGGDRCLSPQKPKEGTGRRWEHKVEKGVQAEGRKSWKVGVCFRCLALVKGEGKAAGHLQGSRKLGASSRMISEVTRETFSKRWRATVRRGAVCHPSVTGTLRSFPKRSEETSAHFALL